MRLVLAHVRAQMLELARYPAYVVPTLAFPAAFFLVLARPHGSSAATVEMATFAGFAVIGVAFFQFGVGIAAERASPWERYLRTLPVAPSARLASRVLAAAPFAAAAAGVTVGAALASTDAALPLASWLELAAATAVGLVPFALLGIALGYLAPERGALPIANLLYLGLSYAGGLWLRPGRLPAGVAAVSPYLPTRSYADALAGIARGDPVRVTTWLQLGGFATAFALVALWAYRREGGTRFR
jgi:ABC-2 type transport system permease protein